MPERKSQSRSGFPWVLLVLLLGTIALFWVWPYFDPPSAPVVDIDLSE